MLLFILRTFFNTNATVVEAFNKEASARLQASVPDILVAGGFSAATVTSLAASLILESKSLRETENILRNLKANITGKV